MFVFTIWALKITARWYRVCAGKVDTHRLKGSLPEVVKLILVSRLVGWYYRACNNSPGWNNRPGGGGQISVLISPGWNYITGWAK